MTGALEPRLAGGAGLKGGAMVLYEYRCDDHGSVPAWRPMGSAPESVDWPVCGQTAMRVYSTAGLSSRSRRLSSVVDRCERSRFEPVIVSSPPPREGPARAPRAPANPALRRLPRP